MDGYLDEMRATRVSGVQARHWIAFFKTYAEAADPDEVTRKLAIKLSQAQDPPATIAASHIADLLREIVRLLAP